LEIGLDQGIHREEVREESNQLEILKLLNTFQRSPNTLSRCTGHSRHNRRRGPFSQKKVPQVCWGLIKGVAYLHKFCIAHRDIKPEDLLVDWDFCQKIINFDVAMQVKDEDEVVNGNGGRRGWMTPDRGEVDVQPDQARPVVKRRSSNASRRCIALGRGERDCREEGLAIFARRSHGGSRRRKREAPEGEEAETLFAELHEPQIPRHVARVQ